MAATREKTVVASLDPSNGAGVSLSKGAGVVATTSLRKLAYERFREMILNRRLRAGQFVSQRELVQVLGVPLGAVREMIPRLEAARLLATVPKRGLQIAHID